MLLQAGTRSARQLDVDFRRSVRVVLVCQVRTDGATVTTTDTSGATDTTGAGGGGGASTTARTGTIAARLRILTFSAHFVWPPRGPHQSEDGASDLANSVSVGILLPIILQLPSQ